MFLINFLKARLREKNSRNAAIAGGAVTLMLWFAFPHFTSGFVLGGAAGAVIVLFLKPDAKEV